MVLVSEQLGALVAQLHGLGQEGTILGALAVKGNVHHLAHSLLLGILQDAKDIGIFHC